MLKNRPMTKNKQRNTLNGWINLYKPLRMGSTDAVTQVKRLIHPSKIGHAGTLDPLATGVLPLALGEGTKCVNLLMDAKKVYEFTVTFGQRRATEDAEGEVIATSDVRPTEEQIRAILPRFTGDIQQMPPAYSALKIDGKRAYDLARAGQEVVLQARPVTVYSLELIECVENMAFFKARVSKGTYIRSLGRDIAQALGSEGYISRLHRAAVGPFTDSNAISLDFLAESVHNAPPPEGASQWLTPLHAALDDIPVLALTAQQVNILRHGQRVTLAHHHPDNPQLAALCEGQMIGLVRVEGNQVISNRLLNLNPMS